MSLEFGLLAFLIILAVLVTLHFARRFYATRTTPYFKGSVSEAMEAFESNTGPLLHHFESPIDCNKAAIAIRELNHHYLSLQRRANQYPEDSESYLKIFNEGLNPVLNKISFASNSGECFKNQRFKKAFDRFILSVQKQGRFSGSSGEDSK